MYNKPQQYEPFLCLISNRSNLKIKTKISNLVWPMQFWNNLHQVRSI